MSAEKIRILTGSSEQELRRHGGMAKLLQDSPIPAEERLMNLSLYESRQTLSRTLLQCEIYKMILGIHGCVLEFGVRWGKSMATFVKLRGIYEPFNYNRKIVGFDTFEGFPSVDAQDGMRPKPGDYAVSENYEACLEEILTYHEENAPIAHRKKFELVKGDASKTVPDYLRKHPETVIALAWFDFDLYAPTKCALEAIRPHLTRGSVLAFELINCPDFPGETQALREIFGLDRFRLERSPLNPVISWLVYEP